MFVYRTLCYAIANSRLSTIEKRLSVYYGLNVALLDIWHKQPLKVWLFKYWSYTARHFMDIPYIDCVSNVYYMAMFFSKFQYLARLL